MLLISETTYSLPVQSNPKVPFTIYQRATSYPKMSCIKRLNVLLAFHISRRSLGIHLCIFFPSSVLEFLEGSDQG